MFSFSVLDIRMFPYTLTTYLDCSGILKRDLSSEEGRLDSTQGVIHSALCNMKTQFADFSTGSRETPAKAQLSCISPASSLWRTEILLRS